MNLKFKENSFRSDKMDEKLKIQQMDFSSICSMVQLKKLIYANDAKFDEKLYAMWLFCLNKQEIRMKIWHFNHFYRDKLSNIISNFVMKREKSRICEKLPFYV